MSHVETGQKICNFIALYLHGQISVVCLFEICYQKANDVLHVP